MTGRRLPGKAGAQAVADVLRLPDVRRIEVGWGLSLTGSTVATVALLVYAYDAGGAGTGSRVRRRPDGAGGGADPSSGGSRRSGRSPAAAAVDNRRPGDPGRPGCYVGDPRPAPGDRPRAGRRIELGRGDVQTSAGREPAMAGPYALLTRFDHRSQHYQVRARRNPLTPDTIWTVRGPVRGQSRSTSDERARRPRLRLTGRSRAPSRVTCFRRTRCRDPQAVAAAPCSW